MGDLRLRGYRPCGMRREPQPAARGHVPRADGRAAARLGRQPVPRSARVPQVVASVRRGRANQRERGRGLRLRVRRKPRRARRPAAGGRDDRLLVLCLSPGALDQRHGAAGRALAVRKTGREIYHVQRGLHARGTPVPDGSDVGHTCACRHQLCAVQRRMVPRLIAERRAAGLDPGRCILCGNVCRGSRRSENPHRQHILGGLRAALAAHQRQQGRAAQLAHGRRLPRVHPRHDRRPTARPQRDACSIAPGERAAAEPLALWGALSHVCRAGYEALRSRPRIPEAARPRVARDSAHRRALLRADGRPQVPARLDRLEAVRCDGARAAGCDLHAGSVHGCAR